MKNESQMATELKNCENEIKKQKQINMYKKNGPKIKMMAEIK